MKISKIRKNTKTALVGKWKNGVAMVLVYLVLNAIIQQVSLLGLVSIIIQVPLTFGLSVAFIKLKRNEKINIFDFLTLGFSNFGRAWGIGFRIVLKIFLMSLAWMFSIAFFIAGVWGWIIPLVIGGIVLFIVSGIWLINSFLKYSLTTYIAYDNPKFSASEIVNESARIMKGNKMKIFLLLLTFAIWFIIPEILISIGETTWGTILFLVLFVCIYPYMQVACICFYEVLIEQNVDGDAIKKLEIDEEVIKEL